MQLVEFLPERVERNFNREICNQKLFNWPPAALAEVIGPAAHGVNYPDVDDTHRAVIVQPLLIAREAIFGREHLNYGYWWPARDSRIGNLGRKDDDIRYTHPGRRDPGPEHWVGF